MSACSDAGKVPGRDQRLDEVIAGYLMELESGRTPRRDEILGRHPDLASELEAFFANQDFAARLGLEARNLVARDPESGAPLEVSSHHGKSPVGGTDPERSGAPARASTPPEPRTFGGYELLEEIARGGMGIVYRARQAGLGRVVALKMVRASQTASREEILRFQLEASASASLDHPNIVPIHDVGEVDGQSYYSMKFIGGGNLGSHVVRLSADPAASARLICSVAEAVHYAHTRGVLHRDLKPGNILIDVDGKAYVSDFGLAKRIGDDSALTQSGAVLGTPSYMSPEQASGKKGAVTTASDVYSLGAILYELLTAAPPFQGDSSVDILGKVLHEEPQRPSRVRPGVPRDLETICLTCLDKDPSRRYATASELASDLQRHLEGKPIHARPATRRERVVKWCRRKPAAAGLVAVSTLALVAFVVLSTLHNRELQFRTEDALAKELLAKRYVYATRMEMAFDEIEGGNISRVRDLLASLIPEAGETDLRGFEWYHLWRCCNLDLFTLRGHTEMVNRVDFSPDSRTLATGSYDGTIKLWDTSRGTEIATLRGPPGHVDALAYSPDGRTLATASEDFVVRLWDLETRKVGKTLQGHTGTVTSAAFSADGRVLATSSGDGTVRLWDPAAGLETAALRDHGVTVHCVTLSWKGDLAASTDHDSIVKVWEMGTRKALLSLDLHGGPALSANFAPNGKTLAVGCWDGTVRLIDLATGKERLSCRWHDQPVCAVRYMPGTPLLVSGAADRILAIGEEDGGVCNARLKGHAGGINSLAISPDRTMIATGSNDGTAKVWSTFTTGEPSTFGGFRDMVSLGAVAADGNSVFLGSRGGTLKYAGLDPRGRGSALTQRKQIDIEATEGTSFVLSADGRSLGVTRDDGKMEVLTILWDQERVSADILLPGPERTTAIVFSPDSTLLVSAEDRGSLVIRERIADPTGTSWRQRTRHVLPVTDVTVLAVSPDAKLLALASDHDPTIHLWSVPRGAPCGILRGHERKVVSLDFSPDSALLASGGLDLAVKLWKVDSLPDVPTPKEPPSLREWLTLNGHTGSIACTAFSPDGKTLASGADDGTVRLWDLVTAESRAELSVRTGHAKELLFAPDGKTLLCGGGRSEAGEVWVWRTATEQEVAERR